MWKLCIKLFIHIHHSHRTSYGLRLFICNSDFSKCSNSLVFRIDWVPQLLLGDRIECDLSYILNLRLSYVLQIITSNARETHKTTTHRLNFRLPNITSHILFFFCLHRSTLFLSICVECAEFGYTNECVVYTDAYFPKHTCIPHELTHDKLPSNSSKIYRLYVRPMLMLEQIWKALIFRRRFNCNFLATWSAASNTHIKKEHTARVSFTVYAESTLAPI